MRSMTGFGRASAQEDGREVTLEIKAVNHRFLDIGFRIPRSLGFLEDHLRRMIGETARRGHVDVYLNLRNTRRDSREVLFDEALAEAYFQAFLRMGEFTGSMEKPTAAQLASLPDVLSVREREEDQCAVLSLVEKAFREAASQFISAREQEGERLRHDIAEKLKLVEQELCHIEQNASSNAHSHMQRLTERIRELLADTQIDPARIAQEAAIIADKSAIDEETVRLRGHIEAMRADLSQPGSLGRRLDFLLQEMNREANTIGSKSTDLTITQHVLNIKGELEKIREQAQNIE